MGWRAVSSRSNSGQLRSLRPYQTLALLLFSGERVYFSPSKTLQSINSLDTKGAGGIVSALTWR